MLAQVPIKSSYARIHLTCTSPRLMRIVGRVDDSFKVRGLFIHASQVREAVSPVSGIVKYVVNTSVLDYFTGVHDCNIIGNIGDNSKIV